MLVLSRQRDQTIMIGDDIEITVVDIRGDKVRLGINAPKIASTAWKCMKRSNAKPRRLRVKTRTSPRVHSQSPVTLQTAQAGLTLHPSR
jgi:carbon storage regulator